MTLVILFNDGTTECCMVQSAYVCADMRKLEFTTLEDGRQGSYWLEDIKRAYVDGALIYGGDKNVL